MASQKKQEWAPSRSDGMVRAFVNACKDGLNKPHELGPTSTLFAGAMSAYAKWDESNLGSAWRKFADKHRTLANFIRRGAAELRWSGPRHGDRIVPMTIKFDDDENSAEVWTVSKKYLIVKNPDHQNPACPNWMTGQDGEYSVHTGKRIEEDTKKKVVTSKKPVTKRQTLETVAGPSKKAQKAAAVLEDDDLDPKKFLAELEKKDLQDKKGKEPAMKRKISESVAGPSKRVKETAAVPKDNELKHEDSPAEIEEADPQDRKGKKPATKRKTQETTAGPSKRAKKTEKNQQENPDPKTLVMPKGSSTKEPGEGNIPTKPSVPAKPLSPVQRYTPKYDHPPRPPASFLPLGVPMTSEERRKSQNWGMTTQDEEEVQKQVKSTKRKYLEMLRREAKAKDPNTPNPHVTLTDDMLKNLDDLACVRREEILMKKEEAGQKYWYDTYGKAYAAGAQLRKHEKSEDTKPALVAQHPKSTERVDDTPDKKLPPQENEPEDKSDKTAVINNEPEVAVTSQTVEPAADNDTNSAPAVQHPESTKGADDEAGAELPVEPQLCNELSPQEKNDKEEAIGIAAPEDAAASQEVEDLASDDENATDCTDEHANATQKFDEESGTESTSEQTTDGEVSVCEQETPEEAVESDEPQVEAIPEEIEPVVGTEATAADCTVEQSDTAEGFNEEADAEPDDDCTNDDEVMDDDHLQPQDDTVREEGLGAQAYPEGNV